jgi:hypothetical protein
MKLANNIREQPIISSGKQDESLWQPWTEVSLAGELGRLSMPHLTTDEHVSNADGQGAGIVESPYTSVAETSETWRSELFFKGESANVLSEPIQLISSAPGDHAELPPVVGSDGRSAADWLIARRKGAAARAGLRTERREAVWAEYDPDAIADYYRRRPLAVLLRLAEASFAFAEWSPPRPAPPIARATPLPRHSAPCRAAPPTAPHHRHPRAPPCPHRCSGAALDPLRRARGVRAGDGRGAGLVADRAAGRGEDAAARRARAAQLRGVLSRLGPTGVKAGQVRQSPPAPRPPPPAPHPAATSLTRP